MAALSKRSKGDERSNLDRGINCINLALADPKVTDQDKADLEKSLNTLLVRRWGKAVTGLVGSEHAPMAKSVFSQTSELPIARSRMVKKLKRV